MSEKNTLRAIALATIYISLIAMCGNAAASDPGRTAGAAPEMSCLSNIARPIARALTESRIGKVTEIHSGSEEHADVPVFASAK